jgi:hypothetical protein
MNVKHELLHSPPTQADQDETLTEIVLRGANGGNGSKMPVPVLPPCGAVHRQDD